MASVFQKPISNLDFGGLLMMSPAQLPLFPRWVSFGVSGNGVGMSVRVGFVGCEDEDAKCKDWIL